MKQVPGGKNICGVSIGVLALESYFPKPPGHIKNPSSLPFTACYEILRGISVPDLLYHPTPAMENTILEAARSLEMQGVKAIAGSCGFLALYQSVLVNAVQIPVFTSSLIQVPLAYQMTGQKVGVITADATVLNSHYLKAVSADHVPVAIAGLQDSEEFACVILHNERNNMDLELVLEELLTVVRELLENNPDIGALVLECTDLPPYAHPLQAEFGLPIFDLTTLACMANDVVQRQPYKGFM